MTLKFNLRQNYSNEKFFTKISKFTFLQKFYILNFIHFLYFIQYFSIFYIIIDERDKKEVDIGGQRLPTLVYMACEKRPQWPHNFKVGAMNAFVIYQILYMSFWVEVMLGITFVNDTSLNNFLLNLFFTIS